MAAVYLPLLFSALALIISFISLLYFKSYLKRRTGQERILSEFAEEVNNILKSINEATDKDISLIEEREKNLKILLEEVDKRLKLYIREMDRRSAAEKAHAALSAENKTAADAYAAIGKNRYKKTPPESEYTIEPKPEDASPPQSRGEQIRSLLRSGFTEAAIASHLGVGIAEVEFVADMMERSDTK